MYARETWLIAKENEMELTVLYRKFIRRIHQPKRNERTGRSGIRSNAGLKELLGDHGITVTIK